MRKPNLGSKILFHTQRQHIFEFYFINKTHFKAQIDILGQKPKDMN